MRPPIVRPSYSVTNAQGGKAALVIGIGLAYIAGRLLQEDPPDPPVDNTSPTLSERGAYAPLVMGQRRVGALIGWVGNRVSTKQSSGGGGKGGGGGGGQTTIIYSEDAWHILCLGPACKMFKVWVSGELAAYPEGVSEIGNATHPSGTLIETNRGSFRIYWGEDDQPIDSKIQTASGVSSRWPGLCYVVWEQFELGQVPQWPTIEYEIVTAVDAVLAQSEMKVFSASGFEGNSTVFDSFWLSDASTGIDDVSTNSEWDDFGGSANTDKRVVRFNGSANSGKGRTRSNTSYTLGAIDRDRYWEGIAVTDGVFGIVQPSSGGSPTVDITVPPGFGDSVSYGLVGSGDVYLNGAIVNASALPFSDGDVLGFRLDILNGIWYGWKNGDTANEVTLVSGLSGEWAVAVGYDGTLAADEYSPWFVGRFSAELIDEPIDTSQNTAWDGSRLRRPLPDNDGINPAHALYQLLTGPHGYGAGIPPASLNLDAFELLGKKMAKEYFAVNLLAASGVTLAKHIGELAQDVGLSLAQTGELLSPVLIRNELSLFPRIPAGLLSVDPVETEKLIDENKVDQVIYQFADRGNAFRTQDIHVSNDAAIGDSEQVRTRTVPIPTVTDYQQADRITRRRQLESTITTETLRITTTRELLKVQPGQVIIAEGIPDALRVLDVERNIDQRTVLIGAIPDIYAKLSAFEDAEEPSYTTPTEQEEPAEDIWRVFELPREIAETQFTTLAWGSVRIPNDTTTLGALSHISADDASYQQLQTPASGNAFGGRLIQCIGDGYSDITDTVSFRVVGQGSASIIEDLTGSTSRWESGEQVLVSELGEVMLLRAITAIDAEHYRIDGLKRAAFGTCPSEHPESTLVFLVPFVELIGHGQNLAAVGEDLYTKIQAFNETLFTDLSTIDPKVLSLRGISRAPLPAANFVGTSTSSADGRYTSTEDISFSFDATEDGENASIPFGDMIIEIHDPDNDAVLRTFTITPTEGANTQAYTNAQIVSDFGAEPDYIRATIYAQSGVNKSCPLTIEVYKEGVPVAFPADRILASRAFYGTCDLAQDHLLTASFNF